MQEIQAEIKALVIFISNEMPDENTDQNATQPPYRLTTCFSVVFFLFKEVKKKEAKKPNSTPPTACKK